MANAPATAGAIETIELTRIRADQRAQPREHLNTDVIETYALDMADGAEFPPMVTFFDDTDYWLADGFNRKAAAEQARLKSFPCEVHKGGLREAILFSCGANAEHGLRRSREDKRRAITRLLEDDEWSKWSDSEIARQCRVDSKTVAKVRAEVAPVTSEIQSEPQPRTYKTKHGSTAQMNTAAIGKSNGGKTLADEMPDIPASLDRRSPERRVVREPAEPAKRPGQGKDAICARAQEAIAALSGMPPAAEVAGYFRGTDLALLVDEHLTEALRWLDEFTQQWGDSDADQD